MSIVRINQYYKDLERIKARATTQNELAIKSAFKSLLNDYCRKKDLEIIEEQTVVGSNKRPDGVAVDTNKFRYGYWEAKDEKDDIEKEIIEKQRIGYPMFNFLIENSVQLVLIQGESKEKINMGDKHELHRILSKFIAYERLEVKEFKEAMLQFQTDLPQVIDVLRGMISTQNDNSASEFSKARMAFFSICQEAINPNIKLTDIDEMLIQHILTEDIFKAIFEDEIFHEENNISKALKKIEKTFFSGDIKRQTLAASRPYYAQIKSRAGEMQDYAQKQDFLKGIYENFYKAYNPKAADTLGIVYTPKEIVNFMLETTEFLLEKHFNKTLSDKNVHILDPATGTGTFITDLMNFLPKQDLEYKYKNEIHANEVAILPYYIANLNIEYTYKNRMKAYCEFKNLCWVDTLDSTGGLKYEGKQTDVFAVTAENTQRIKNQNEQKISVIIGNPPYNARQQNFNDQNANRVYRAIDKRIEQTFAKQGSAQNKIVLYDMYARFYRWAMDRMDENGVIAFITNRSFVDGKAFDGFRKVVQKEFNEIYIIDLQGDVRKNNYIEQGGNVFNIMTGICIAFFIKKEVKDAIKIAKIFYHNIGDNVSGKEKLQILLDNPFHQIDFDLIKPDSKHNWIKQTDNDFESHIPLIDKDVKAGKKEESIFKLFSLGVATHRDSWNYDLSKVNLQKKISFLVDIYKKTLKDIDFEDKFKIAWDADLENYLKRKINIKINKGKFVKSLFRPFTVKWYYFDKHLNARLYQWEHIYNEKENLVIGVNREGSNKPFHCLVSNLIFDLHTTGDTTCLPLYRYSDGERLENITNWALDLFRNHYAADKFLSDTLRVSKTLRVSERNLEKTDIFHYVYAVLHRPEYRQKYEQNLKREFPRIPLYDDFWKYAEAGKKLMELHINYELEMPNYEALMLRKDVDLAVFKAKKQGKKKKTDDADKEVTAFESDFVIYPILRIKDNNIEIDELTMLCGVPAEALAYKLGNRSAIEWVLDQYKPYTSADKTIQEQFNTYNFADYKEEVINLLQKVCFVSVETMKIIGAL